MARARTGFRTLFPLAAALACSVLLLPGCPKKSDGPLDADAGAGPIDRTQDRAHVVQALLDSPWVQDALERNDDAGAHSALVVVVPPDLQSSALQAFGQSAKVLSVAQAQAQRPESFLELLDLQIDGERARLKFRDEAERVSGEAQLERSAKGWRVVDVSGTEH